jgi:hypothetical protein
MPEFEEENLNASQSETYTPSTDASPKRRTRRRSGGFKNEVAPISNAKIGEVEAAKALKEEKLSGPAKSGDDAAKAPAPRAEREPRQKREPRAEREPRHKREPREPRQARSDANPQPSPETLAAIARVESQIAERRAERDARRSERDKNRPPRSKTANGKSAESGKPSVAATSEAPSEGGLLATISGFFGKLFGSDSKSPPKKAGQNRTRGGQNQSRSGRPQNKRGPGGQRGGQNRGRGGQGGQGRKRGGKGPRRSDRRTNEQVES